MKELKLSDVLIHQLISFDDKILNILDWKDPRGPSSMGLEEREALYQEGVSFMQMVKDALNWIKSEHKEESSDLCREE